MASPGTGTVPTVSAHFRSLFQQTISTGMTIAHELNWTELTQLDMSTQLHHAFIGHARQRQHWLAAAKLGLPVLG